MKLWCSVRGTIQVQSVRSLKVEATVLVAIKWEIKQLLPPESVSVISPLLKRGRRALLKFHFNWPTLYTCQLVSNGSLLITWQNVCVQPCLGRINLSSTSYRRNERYVTTPRYLTRFCIKSLPTSAEFLPPFYIMPRNINLVESVISQNSSQTRFFFSNK